MHACVHACMRACVHACMHACVHACMRACMYSCMRNKRHVIISKYTNVRSKVTNFTKPSGVYTPSYPIITVQNDVNYDVNFFVIVVSTVFPFGRQHFDVYLSIACHNLAL